MRYRVVAKDGIMRGATGERWGCGDFISPHSWPKALFDRLVADGVIQAEAGEVADVEAMPTAYARAAELDVEIQSVSHAGKRVTAADVEDHARERKTRRAKAQE